MPRRRRARQAHRAIQGRARRRCAERRRRERRGRASRRSAGCSTLTPRARRRRDVRAAALSTRASRLAPVTTGDDRAAGASPACPHARRQHRRLPRPPRPAGRSRASARWRPSISSSRHLHHVVQRGRGARKTISPMPPARPSASVGRPGRSSSARPSRSDSRAPATPRAGPRPPRGRAVGLHGHRRRPAISPPPPTGTSRLPGRGSWSRSSSADGALAGRGPRIVEGVDVEGTRESACRTRVRPDGLVVSPPVSRTSTGKRRSLSSLARGAVSGTKSVAPRAPPRAGSREGHAERVVAGRGRHHAARALGTRRATSAFSAPRTLNEPVGCQHSSFSTGRGRARRTSAAAAWAAGTGADRSRASLVVREASALAEPHAAGGPGQPDQVEARLAALRGDGVGHPVAQRHDARAMSRAAGRDRVADPEPRGGPGRGSQVLSPRSAPARPEQRQRHDRRAGSSRGLEGPEPERAQARVAARRWPPGRTAPSARRAAPPPPVGRRPRSAARPSGRRSGGRSGGRTRRPAG